MAAIRLELQVDAASGAATVKSFTGDLDDLEKKSKGLGAAMSSIFQGIGQGVGGGIFDTLKSTLQALPGMALASTQAVMKMGGEMVNFAARTGIAAEAQGRLKFAAEGVGTTLDAVAAGIGKMQQNLVNAPEAFLRLGMSVKDLRSMKPEEQFEAIAAQIARIEDPAQRSAAAVAVFGKAGIELLPLLTSDMKAAGDEAERLGLVMSNQTAAAAEALGSKVDVLMKAWEGLGSVFGSVVVNNASLHAFLSGLIDLIGEVSVQAHKNKVVLNDWVTDGVIGLARALVITMQVLDRFIQGWSNLKGVWLGMQSAGAIVSLELTKMNKAVDGMLGRDTSAYDATITHYEKILLEIGKTANAEAEAAKERRAHSEAMIAKLKELEAAVEKNRGKTLDLGGAVRRTGDDYNFLGKAAKDAAINMNPAFMGPTMEELEGKRLSATNTFFHLQTPILAKAPPGSKIDLTDAQVKLPDIKRSVEEWADSFRSAADALSSFLDLLDVLGVKAESKLAAVTEGMVKLADAGADFAASFAANDVGGMVAAGIKGVSAVVGMVNGLFKSEARKVNDLRDAFIESHGGLDKLREKAFEAGMGLEELLRADRVSSFNAAVAQLNAGFAKLAEQQRQMALLAEGTDLVNEAVKRYGFTVDELGDRWQAQELDKKAGQLFQDYELLKAAGVDLVAIQERMGTAASEYLNTAIRTGTSVPIAMKPMLLDMAKAGTLLKENGEAFTEAEVEGLSYTQTMSQMFTELIKKVNDLVNALLGLGNVNVTPQVNLPGGGGAVTPGGPKPQPGDNYGTGAMGLSYRPPAAASMGGVQVGAIHLNGSATTTPEAFALAFTRALRENTGGVRSDIRYAVAG